MQTKGGDNMLFNKSEEIVKLITTHCNAVTACYTTYQHVFEHYLTLTSDEERAPFNRQMKLLESEADHIRHQIIHKLLQGHLLLDSRKSIMRLIEGLDNVADVSEEIIREMYFQKMTLEPSLAVAAQKMNQITYQQLLLLIEVFKNIVSKYNQQDQFMLIREVELLESKVDEIENEILFQVFRNNRSLSEQMQLKDLITKIGSISDLIEDLSDEIEIIMMVRKV